MNAKTASVMAAIIAMSASFTLPAHANWEASSFPGESGKAAMGCSAADFDDAWLCLAVRCDAPGDMNLYIELTNLDIDDAFSLVIDGQRFGVTGNMDVGDAPYSSRLEGNTGDILEALKTGNAVFLDRPQHPFTQGFDTVPLRGSGAAIAAIERSCQASGEAANADAGSAVGESLLPLRIGLYVRQDTACDARTHATTMSYWGDRLNSQRAEGTIESVSADGTDYHVLISAYDIAEEEDLGQFDWALSIPSPESFSFAPDDPTQTYRWCEDLPGQTSANLSSPALSTTGESGRFPGYVAPADIDPIDESSANARAVVLSAAGEKQEALKLFLQAAKRGDMQAATNAGLLLTNGNGIDIDRDRGRSLLETAAEAGDGFALLALGRTYHFGWGVETDMVRAIAYYRRAAETPAAPEANHNLSFAVGYEAQAKLVAETSINVEAEICFRSHYAGHRWAIVQCRDFDPQDDFIALKRQDWDLAVKLLPWASGMNLSKAYIGEFFTDHDENLRQYLTAARATLEDALGVDVDAKLAVLNQP